MPVCPSLPAYKTPPFCLLQHSPLSKPDHQRAPASFPLETMSGFLQAPTFHSKTSAVNHAGFPRLLWEMLSEPLAVLLTLITRCSNPSLSFAFADTVQR